MFRISNIVRIILLVYAREGMRVYQLREGLYLGMEEGLSSQVVGKGVTAP